MRRRLLIGDVQVGSEIVPSAPGAYVAFHWKENGLRAAVLSELWSALEASGEVADGVLLVVSGREPIVIAPTDASSSTVPWSASSVTCNYSFITSSDQVKLDFNGRNYIANIVKNVSGNYAGPLCYQYPRPGIPATQWWLPSGGELQAIYDNKAAINLCLGIISGASQLNEAEHWSSTERSQSHAWFLNLSAGLWDNDYKSFGNYRVRAVAAFENYSTHNRYEFVDLGLPSGLLWATCNIGASNPFDYGLYFAWGETKGYVNASAKSGGFTWGTTPYWVSGTSASSTKWSKYTATNEYSSTGKADNKLVLELEDDAAHVIMGDDWRMPTSAEFLELYNACNTTWTTQNGIYGRLFTLKTDSSKQLFFPASGYATSSSMYNQGSNGNYWSSSLNALNSYWTYNLYFGSSDIYPQSQGGNRCDGYSVRGVLDKN